MIAPYDPDHRLKRLETHRLGLLDHLARIDEEVRETNLRLFRDAMRDVFVRHAVLESVHIEASVAYTDDCYAFSLSDAVVNGIPFFADGLLNQGPYRDVAMDARPKDWGDQDVRMHRKHGDEIWYDVMHRYPSPPPGTPAYAEREAEARGLMEASRSMPEGLSEAGMAAGVAMLALAERFGDRFFLDAFGFRAAVTVRRDAIEITTDVHAEGARDTADGLTWSWEDRYVGGLRDDYLTSEAHGGLVGLRESLRARVQRTEHALIHERMQRAADRLRTFQPLAWTVSGTDHYGNVESVIVGGVEVVLPERGRLATTGRGPSGTDPRARVGAALREAHGDTLADAADAWIGALLDVAERYGLPALLSMPPNWQGVTVHRFGYPG